MFKIRKTRIIKETGNSVLVSLQGYYRKYSVWISRIECSDAGKFIEVSLMSKEYEIQQCKTGDGTRMGDECTFRKIKAPTLENSFKKRSKK